MLSVCVSFSTSYISVAFCVLLVLVHEVLGDSIVKQAVCLMVPAR